MRVMLPFGQVFLLLCAVALMGCGNPSEQAAAYREQAEKHTRERAYPAAVVEYKNALQLQPDHVASRLALAQVYLKMGQASNAEKELLRARQLKAKPEETDGPLATAMILLGEYERALKDTYPDRISEATKRAALLSLHGDARLGLEQWNDGCDLYRQALGLNPRHVEAYWGLARCAMREKGPSASRAMLDQALAVDRNRARSWSEIGDLEYGGNRLDAADLAYREALRLDPADLNSLLGRALVALRQNRADAAVKAAKELDARHPGHPLAKTLQAVEAFQRGRYADTNAALSEVLKAMPNHLPSLMLHGMAAYSLGNYEDARRSLSRFLLAYPGRVDIRKLLASTQIKLGRGLDALDTLDTLISDKLRDPETLVLAGEAQLLNNKLNSATDYFSRAVSFGADSTSARILLAKALALRGQHGRAKEEIGLVLRSHPGDFHANATLARIRMEAGEYEQALQLLDELVRTHPANAELFQLRSEALVRMNDTVKLSRVLASNPADTGANLALAKLEMREGKLDAAEKHARIALERNQNDEPTLLLLAEIAQSRGQVKESLAWLERAHRNRPDRIEPILAISRHHLRGGNPLKALEWARQAEKISPRESSVLEALTAAQLAMGDKAGALSTFHRLTQLNPLSPEIHFKQAQMLLNVVHDRSGARHELRQAIRLRDDYLDAQITLARLEIDDAMYDTARAVAETIQNQRPNLSTGLILEGDILFARHRYDAAAAVYGRALNKQEGGKALVKLHRALNLAGKKAQAEGALNDWLIAHPDDVPILLYRADVLLASNREKQAKVDLETVQRLQPDLPLVLNNLATIYQAEKNPLALEYAQRAFAKQPKNPFVLDTLGWIVLEKGDAKRASDLLGEAVSLAPHQPQFVYHLAAALEKRGSKSEARERLKTVLERHGAFPERAQAEALMARLGP